jgi:hypothetical protein
VRSIVGSAAVSGSRAAVLRRNEGTRLRSARDDEVGGYPVRSALATSRRRSAGGPDETHQEQSSFVNGRFRRTDEDGGFPANIARAERAEQSGTTTVRTCPATVVTVTAADFVDLWLCRMH